MKKILLFIFMVLASICTVNAYDVTDTFYYDTQVPNMYITKVKGDKVKSGAPFLLHRSDGKLVYCIDPFIYMDGGIYEGYNGFNSIFNISEEAINKMNLIAHYGYGYKDHTDIKWYGITQYLIWEELELDDIYFTDKLNGNRIIAYEDEINEMKKLIQDHYITPSFDNIINVEANKEIVLEDKNNVLSNFEVIGNGVKVDGNKLIINASAGTYDISFIKRENKENYMLYYSANGQDLLLPGKIQDLLKDIKISAKNGSLKLIKHDKNTDKPKTGLSFENAVYGLYDLNGNLIKELKLNSDGEVSIDLPFGSYYLLEITPPVGYLKDNNKHYFDISFDKSEIKLDVYDEIISKFFTIKKMFGNEVTRIYSYEKGAIFEIYDSDNNLVGTYTTDDNGIINVKLTYGKYRVHQVSTLDGYKMNDDFYIDVFDDVDEEVTLYDNEIPIPVPDTYKNDIDYVSSLSLLALLLLYNIGVVAYKKSSLYINS